MMARTHLAAGAACWILVAKATGLSPDAIGIAAACFGSLMPDIDHPKSVLGRKIHPISALLAFIFGHRGITHSLLAVIAWVALAAHYGLVKHYWVAAMAVGYLSHLLCDWMTPAGVPFLYPSRRKFTCAMTVKTGGGGESIILIGICFLLAVEARYLLL